MEAFIVWTILSVLVGWLASSRGRSGVGFFFLSLLLSPLIGLIAAVVVKDLAAEAEEEERRRAQALREETIRRHEHDRQLASIQAIARATSGNPGGTEKLCPFCAETIKAAAIKCRHCGSDLSTEAATLATQVRQDPEKLSLLPQKNETGVCPNCSRACGMTDDSCQSCGASFADGSAWKPRTRQLGEVVPPALPHRRAA